MTESYVEPVLAEALVNAGVTAAEPAQPDLDTEPDMAEVAEANCRHCGAIVSDTPGEGGDWLCPECERYQHTVKCPTCKQPVSVDMLRDDDVPAAHAPQRRRKARD